jgi:hypothetical protein
MIADAGFRILRIAELKPGKDLKKAIQYIMTSVQEYHIL